MAWMLTTTSCATVSTRCATVQEGGLGIVMSSLAMMTLMSHQGESQSRLQSVAMMRTWAGGEGVETDPAQCRLVRLLPLELPRHQQLQLQLQASLLRLQQPEALQLAVPRVGKRLDLRQDGKEELSVLRQAGKEELLLLRAVNGLLEQLEVGSMATNTDHPQVRSMVMLMIHTGTLTVMVLTRMPMALEALEAMATMCHQVLLEVPTLVPQPLPIRREEDTMERATATMGRFTCTGQLIKVVPMATLAVWSQQLLSVKLLHTMVLPWEGLHHPWAALFQELLLQLRCCLHKQWHQGLLPSDAK